MNIQLLTNPFVIGYVIVIALLYWSGSGLKRMAKEAEARNRERARERIQEPENCSYCCCKCAACRRPLRCKNRRQPQKPIDR